MVRFGGGIYGQRRLTGEAASPLRQDVVRGDKDTWSPPTLIKEFETRKLRAGMKVPELLPRISARSMRLALYRGLAKSGASALDSIDVNVEWANAVLFYSGMKLLSLTGESRGMKVYGGYDPRLIEYALGTFEEGGASDLFRIYARTASTAKDIVESSELLASHRGYISQTEGGLEHFEDLTGVFITRPGVAPKRVGISGYEHFVDFRLAPSVQRFHIKGQPEHLIPGPPRLSREEIEQAEAVLSGERGSSEALPDAVELLRMFPDGPPRFAIPIEVVGRGKLSDMPPSGVDTATKTNTTGAALMIATGAARTSVMPPMRLPMRVPFI